MSIFSGSLTVNKKIKKYIDELLSKTAEETEQRFLEIEKNLAQLTDNQAIKISLGSFDTVDSIHQFLNDTLVENGITQSAVDVLNENAYVDDDGTISSVKSHVKSIKSGVLIITKDAPLILFVDADTKTGYDYLDYGVYIAPKDTSLDTVREFKKFNSPALPLARLKTVLTQQTGYEYIIKPDNYIIGSANVTGTWSSTDESVEYIELLIDGSRQNITTLGEDGTFSISSKSLITSTDQVVELQLAKVGSGDTKIGVGGKIIVIVQNS